MPRVLTLALASLALASLALGSLAIGVASCTGGARSRADEEPSLGRVALALTDTDPVSAAVDAGCTTTSVKGLAAQLVGEIQCSRPGSMKSIEGAAGLSLGPAVFPFLQSPAADALLAAQKTRGTTMVVSSALRTLPQQYLLYRWYQAGTCGISLAAAPGKSNHETAAAVDVEDSTGWRPAMTSAGFRWLGASDPVHFDYTGAGTIDMAGVSVAAFQRLWNRNHAEDPIAEDGAYGAETEKRLTLAPVGGFPRGPEGCAADASPPPVGPPSPTPPSAPPEPVPDAQEPTHDGSGCSAAGAPRLREASGGLTASLDGSVLALVLLGARAWRRRPRAENGEA